MPGITRAQTLPLSRRPAGATISASPCSLEVTVREYEGLLEASPEVPTIDEAGSPFMLWIVVRSLIVVGGALSGPSVARWQYPDASPPLIAAFFLGMLILGAAFVVSLAAFTRLGMRPGQLWDLPTWRARPFPGGPAQAFHALAWYFIAGGVSAIVATLWVPHPSLQGGVALSGLGTGFLVGCHASVHLFRSAFSKPIPHESKVGKGDDGVSR